MIVQRRRKYNSAILNTLVRYYLKADIKVIKLIMKGMALGLFIIIKVEGIAENGYQIKCKVEEFCIMQVERSHMKANGKMID